MRVCCARVMPRGRDWFFGILPRLIGRWMVIYGRQEHYEADGEVELFMYLLRGESVSMVHSNVLRNVSLMKLSRVTKTL